MRTVCVGRIDETVKVNAYNKNQGRNFLAVYKNRNTESKTFLLLRASMPCLWKLAYRKIR